MKVIGILLGISEHVGGFELKVGFLNVNKKKIRKVSHDTRYYTYLWAAVGSY